MAAPDHSPAAPPTAFSLLPDGPLMHIYGFLDRKDVACVLPRVCQTLHQALAPETVGRYV